MVFKCEFLSFPEASYSPSPNTYCVGASRSFLRSAWETDLLEIGLGRQSPERSVMRGVGLTNLPSADSCQRPGKRIVGSQALCLPPSAPFPPHLRTAGGQDGYHLSESRALGSHPPYLPAHSLRPRTAPSPLSLGAARCCPPA